VNIYFKLNELSLIQFRLKTQKILTIKHLQLFKIQWELQVI